MLRLAILSFAVLSAAFVLAGCGPEATLIVGATGGSVASDDGVFSIFFPPGALPSDTEVSIETIGPEQWGADAPGRFERLGAVYRVEPAGLLSGAAFAVVELPSVPGTLRSGAGDDVMALHYVWNGEKVRPAPATRTLYLDDGRVAVVARILELGEHWTGERVARPDRVLVQLSARLAAETGPHDDGSEWRWTEGSLRSDDWLDFLSREVRVSVASGAGAPTILPIEDGAAPRTWDATWDEDLGPHVWEVFGVNPDGRSETVVTLEDRMPFSVEPGMPTEPVFEPFPGWTCAGASGDEASLFAGIDVVTGASDGAITVGVSREIGRASCR